MRDPDNVIRLADITENGLVADPCEELRRLAEECDDPEIGPPTKLVVLRLFVDPETGDDSIRLTQTGSRMLEVVGLLELGKIIAMKEMGYVPDGE